MNCFQLEFDAIDEVHFVENITKIAICAKSSTNAERCSIFLYDIKSDRLYTVYADGIKGKLSLKTNLGLVGYSFHKKRSIIENYIKNSTIFFKNVDQKLNYKTSTILCSPIIGTDQKRYGVIELLNNPKGFTYKDQLKLEKICTTALLLFEPKPSLIETFRQENKSTLLQSKLDFYLEDKKLYLMEDQYAYYKLVGLEREYFISADQCYLLKENATPIESYYYNMDDEFLPAPPFYIRFNTKLNTIEVAKNDHEDAYHIILFKQTHKLYKLNLRII